MADWRVLVVEDDPIVAGLHRRFVSRVRGFEVVAVASTAAQAQAAVRRTRPDLILLDIGLPGDSGLDLLRRLRATGEAVEAIAVTAATATPAVRAAVQLGAVDYIVKPFDLDRLRKSLGLFQRRMTMLATAQLAQPDVDRICSDGPNAYRWLPRDISGERLEQVRESLSKAGSATTAAHVAAEVGIARVTARRYLEYLVTIGQATMEPVVTGPGRPRKTYRFVGSALDGTPVLADAPA
jgi:response regulator of citrate/malate metabolism